MLRRKLYDKLKSWKENSNGSTALLIKDARRVGKSFLCEYFGKMNMKDDIS